jgi:DNA (cytosine-5)-methyltransferase 1
VDAEGAAGGHLLPMAVSENQRAEVLETPIARQLTSGGGKPGQGYSAVREANGVRRLTPIECERLMSWPDGWTLADEKTADSRRYAACGDGVVSNVAEWIGRRIMAVDALETANPHPEGRGSVE